MVEKYKQETGRERASSKVKKEFKEEAIQTLLPRAFTKRSSTALWIDPVNKFLVVDSGSRDDTRELAAGSIIVDLLLRTGSFETDTDRARKKLS